LRFSAVALDSLSLARVLDAPHSIASLVSVMAHCSSLEETEREIAATALAEATQTGGGHAVTAISDGEGHVSSGSETDDSGDGGASDNEFISTLGLTRSFSSCRRRHAKRDHY
jgi:hypothetical protein